MAQPQPQRLTADPDTKPINFWFGELINGKVTCVRYLDEERIDIVKPFELSCWREQTKAIVKYMVAYGWPRRPIDFQTRSDNSPAVARIMDATLTECNLMRRELQRCNLRYKRKQYNERRWKKTN